MHRSLTPQLQKQVVLVGALLALFLATAPASADIITFQRGVDGYASVRDTTLINNQGDNSERNPLAIQSGDNQFSTKNGLLQFDQIFGNTKIPFGSTIVSATLELRTHDFVDSAGGRVNLHRMLMPWNETENATDYGQPPWNNQRWVQSDDFEARSAISVSFDPTAIDTLYSIDVTSDLQAWSDGTPYYGWVLLGDPSQDDLVNIVSSDSSTRAYRPRLVVQFNAIPEPGTMGCLALLGVAMMCRRRRKVA